MSRPVIWYLHHYAGAPSLGMSYRPYYLSKEFNGHGYQSYVIGASFHHLLTQLLNVTQAVQQETIDGQAYVFLKTPSYRGHVTRVLNMLSYVWKLWRYRKQLIEITGIPAVIIASSAHPYHFLPALRIAQQYNAKLIFEVRDLWPMSLVELMHLSPRHPLVWLTGYIEKMAYQRADSVVSLLPNALPYMCSRGLIPDRFVYISNGVAVSDSLNDEQPLRQDYAQELIRKKQQGQFIMAYVGAHGIPNSLDDLIQALLVLKRDGVNHIHVVLVGHGVQKQQLMDFAAANTLDSITFFDVIPKSQVMSLLRRVDAVYLGWKDKPVYQYGISPNKLFDYLLAEKPILHAFSGSDDVVAQSGAGLTVEAENPRAIAEGLKTLAAMPTDALQAMGRRGKAAVLSRFSYEQLGQKYMTLFNELKPICVELLD